MVADNIVEWQPQAVEAACHEILKEFEAEERRQFQRIIQKHCVDVLRQRNNDVHPISNDAASNSVTVESPQSPPASPEKTSPKKPSSNSSSQYTVTHRKHSFKHDVSVPVTPLTAPPVQGKPEETPTPLPKYEFCVPITSSYLVPDEPELAFVPLIEKRGDAPLSRHTVLSMHQTSYRERLIEYGAECAQERVHRRLDAIFRRLFTLPSADGDVRIPPPDHKVWARIANGTREPRSRVLDRFRAWLTTHVVAPKEEAGDADPDAEESNALDTLFEKEMDTYRKLWCRQCYSYDCNLHGLANKPSIAVQTLLAKLKEQDGFWKDRPPDVNMGALPTHIVTKELSGIRRAMCKQLYDIFEGNVEPVSTVLGVPIPVVEEYLERQRQAGLLDEVYQPLHDPTARHKKKGLNAFSVKHYRPEWYKRYRDSKIFPLFYPCLHDTPCSDFSNCTCIQNRFFCTPACAWNRRSPNFFRGCDCKGNCTTTCTCFLGKRECDPNLCKCTVATDPPNQLISTQRCRNDNMTMHRRPHLLIGVSSVAGWGVFTRRPLQTGDYVGKYVGEVMSQEEAERRGLIADEKGCSYLFLMASDVSIDACRKGSKVRFINHSSTPNVKPQTFFVRGEQQIGFYALQDIPEQTELFFDYNYKSICDESLTEHPLSNVPWLNKKK